MEFYCTYKKLIFNIYYLYTIRFPLYETNKLYNSSPDMLMYNPLPTEQLIMTTGHELWGPPPVIFNCGDRNHDTYYVLSLIDQQSVRFRFMLWMRYLCNIFE